MSVILLNHVTYLTLSDNPIFKELSLALSSEKTGLIGKNGVGKSTLLKLIIGELQPHTGSIETSGTLAYCPQETHFFANNTIAEMLGISEKMQAIARVLAGSLDENDFSIIGDDWNIEENAVQQLNLFGLSYLDIARQVHSLSGGEKTRLCLARAFLLNPDFIILDEPTNNLDITSRQFLYEAIAAWKNGLLVVSHDRELLNLMEQIIEITSLGVTTYGGNYDHFVQQKKLMQDAAERELSDATKSMSKTKSSVQTNYEKHEKKKSYGRKLFLSGSIDKMAAGSKKGRSEKTQQRHSKLHETLLKNSEEKIKSAKEKIEISHEIKIDLPMTSVPNGKIILEIENLNFGYDNKTIIQDFNLKISGPERVALAGKNGSGKTTLIKLIQHELTPLNGTIYLGTSRISYLDQTVSLLDPELSIFENYLRLNPDTQHTEAHAALAQFIFRNTAALKRVKELSGGEKLRAQLACVLTSKLPPQLLILDEPTNHLDLNSVLSIESALNQYKGTLIVISHDQTFLKNIDVTRVYSLSS